MKVDIRDNFLSLARGKIVKLNETSFDFASKMFLDVDEIDKTGHVASSVTSVDWHSGGELSKIASS